MIHELMTGGLITVRPETSVQQARDLLAKERIRHLPVTGPGGVLAGIVTDREGAQLMLDHKVGALPVLDDGHLIGIITETDIVRAFVRTTAPASSFRP